MATVELEINTFEKMNTKVLLVESPTIWLLKIDGDNFVSEEDDFAPESLVELTALVENVNGKSKTTQTLSALEISEKEQTCPIIMKVIELNL